MAFAPNTSTFVTVSSQDVDLPNSQVLTAGEGLQIVSSGPGGNVTVNTVGNLLSLTQVAANGMMSINHSTNTIFTRTLASDDTLTITNPDGVSGSPSFSVNPQTQVQLIQVSANSGSIVGSRPTLRFLAGGDTTVGASDNPGNNSIDITITSTGGGGGGGISAVDGTTNQITANTVSDVVTLSLPNTLIAPGTFAATTSITTPLLMGITTFTNPWTTQPVSNGQVLSCQTNGTLAWVNNGSGGSGVSSIGLTSPLGTLNVGTTTTNPITSTGTFQVDLANPCTTPGNFTVNGVLAISGAFSFPTAPGTSGYVLTSDGAGGSSWMAGGGGGAVASVTGTSNQIIASPTTGNVILSLPSTLVAPGDVLVTGGLSTPVLNITGGFVNPWPTNPSVSGQVLSSDTSGNFVWISATGTGTVTNIQTNNGLTGGPITTMGTIGLANPCTTPGNFTVNGVLAISGAFSFPTAPGTSGYVLTSDGIGGSSWMAGGGGGSGVPSISTNANQILVNGGTGPVTTAATLTFSNTLQVPGTLRILNNNLGANDYIFPTNRGTGGYFLQTDGAGNTTWAAGGGGGGAVNTVAVTGSNSTGLVITPNTGNVTVGWDTTQNAVYPMSAEFNSLSGDPLKQFILPVNEGGPGYYITYPDSGNQTYWSANYVTEILGTAFQITASGPTNGVVTLSFPSTQIFPGSLTTTSTVSASSFFAVSNSSPLNFWPSHLPTAPGGLLTSSTSGSLSWSAFDMTPTPSTTMIFFSYDGGTTTSFLVATTFSIAAGGVSVNFRLDLTNLSIYVCPTTTFELISTTPVSSPYLPSTTTLNYIGLGSIPIYNSTTNVLYYGQCYLKNISGSYYIAFSLWCDTNTTSAPYNFTSGDTYLFGVDNSAITTKYASFTYPINIIN